MLIEYLNIMDKRWLDYISGNHNATIFHHPNWMMVLSKQYKYKNFIVAVVNSKKEILAGIPFCEIKTFKGRVNWISLPFSDYCSPLFENEESINFLEEYLVNKAKKGDLDSIEIRGELGDSKFFSKSDDLIVHSTVLSEDIDYLFSTFKKTQIQQPIRKAEKEGLSYEITTSEGSLETFYKLHLKTRKKLGVPIQPKRFFRNIYNELNKNGNGICSFDKKRIKSNKRVECF